MLRFWRIPQSLLLLILLLNSNVFQELRSEAQRLAPNEFKVLEVIARKLNIKYWDFNENDPCKQSGEWNETGVLHIKRSILCNCSSACHVTTIELKGQNLTGELPEEFADLPFLVDLDLTLNNLNGSIPARWATLPLVHLSIYGNRVTAPIPKEFGNISTLKSLVLSDNQLGGPLPPELGNLSNLEQFQASANNFSGPLPRTFGKLTNLTMFLIDGNPISGKIPDFIGNWTRITRLDMQGTSMEGPIPSTISNLKILTELRISDLIVPSVGFPPLDTMQNMKKLVLRNCLMSAEIPEFIGNMKNLNTLDLSFNNLTGKIPENFEALTAIKYMFLTNNLLTGDIPQWILSSQARLDVSNNNFTGPDPPSSCQQGNVNLAASYSSTSTKITSTNSCFRRNIPCSKKAQYFSLFINCGGKKLPIGDQKYEEDLSELGPSTFSSNEIWAYSSTGDYLDNDKAHYRTINTSVLNISNPDLYMTARLAPLSLKYYGLCLQNGNYTVKLYFAEIMFTDDQTYSSIGRRIFDVSLQGQRVLKDFNIEDEGGGPGREVIKKFFTNVTDNTLEIHLYWAGKGTTGVPDQGFYGPLISAITVTPNFKPDTGDSGRLSVGAIAGIAIGCCVIVILIVLFLYLKVCLGGKEAVDKELRGLKAGYFSLKQIKIATNNFNSANKLGEGGFGPVYKGTLSDGTAVAVKQLSSISKQGNREFLNEIGMISALQHPNLVKIFGCCVEGKQLLVVYEYMENNSVASALFGREEYRLKLDWPTRHNICLGIARGLSYLHEESRLKIVHRDIKPTNVLLDKDLNAKISDFGLAKLDEGDKTHISTRIAGTLGYMAPEYAMRGYLTDKADVYSFGVVVLEIVSGKSNTNYKPQEDFVHLLDEAYVLQEQGNLLELVDPNLGSNYSMEEALRTLNLALLCTNPSPSLRPAMSSAISMLEGKTEVRAPLVKRTSGIENWRFKAFGDRPQDSQMQSMSSGWPSAYSSVSLQSRGGENVGHQSSSLPLISGPLQTPSTSGSHGIEMRSLN